MKLAQDYVQWQAFITSVKT